MQERSSGRNGGRSGRTNTWTSIYGVFFINSAHGFRASVGCGGGRNIGGSSGIDTWTSIFGFFIIGFG